MTKGLLVLVAVLLAACDGSAPGKKADGKASDGGADLDADNLLANTEKDQLFLELDRRVGEWQRAREEEGHQRTCGSLERHLRRRVDDNIDVLLASMKDKTNPRGQLIASKVLGFSSRPEAAPALCELLTADNPDLLLHALFGLTRLASATLPTTKIAVHLDSFDARVQAGAALLLSHAIRKGASMGGRVRENAVMRLNVLLLDDKHSMVRAHAAAALGALGDPKCEVELLHLLRDEDIYVRLRAIMALSHVGTDRSLDSLVQMLGAPEPKIPSMASRSLWIITRRLEMNIDGAVLGVDPKAWRAAIRERRREQ